MIYIVVRRAEIGPGLLRLFDYGVGENLIELMINGVVSLEIT